jgi:hypothetical protein
MFKCPHCNKAIPDRLIFAHAGSVSGKKIAKERGPEYFSKLQARRKHRRGGRPRKKTKEV